MAQWLFIWIGLSLFAPEIVLATESDPNSTATTTQQTPADAPTATTADGVKSETSSTEKEKAKEESDGGSEPDCE